MFFAAAASILGLKNLSHTQTQAIDYINIHSDLHLALGLCISLVVHKNHFKIGLLVITMVKYVRVNNPNGLILLLAKGEREMECGQINIFLVK